MKEFLYELAEKIHREHTRLDTVTLVFPNRRAILYFRKHLTSLLRKPAFAPQLLTIEEFIASFSSSRVPDKLQLLKILYHTHTAVSQQHGHSEAQSFSTFYFWGEMLLRDFDEIDKYLVNASQLFVDLTNQKEIETIFEFLSEEQVSFLKEFWGNFNEHPSVKKEQFLRVWRMLSEVYLAFKNALQKQGLAYNGMLHREVAESLTNSRAPEQLYAGKALVFAGFNALTLAEERIVTYFVEHHQAQAVWDTDAYYVNNHAQEAGTFFREYKQHAVLGKTFSDSPANLQQKINHRTLVQVVGAAQPIGQVKAMAQVLEQQLAAGWKAEETLLVLPDEKLLLPVLHSIPAAVTKLNVTMGFPLASAPLYNLIELLFELQVKAASDSFHHRSVLALLHHPYILSIAGDTSPIRKKIADANWVDVPQSFFTDATPALQVVFKQVEPNQMLNYLRQVIETIGLAAVSDLDKEYAFQFYTFINRLQEIAESELLAEHAERKQTLQAMLRVLQQLARAERIPFAGEPLEGLQIMGVLETRNLDYKNVLILSLNEGSLPASGSGGSYIPYNLRKAYSLPTAAHQDAMYAYLFYRLLQRTDNVCIFYNTETDVLGQGEMSRYLQQLIYESGLNVQEHVVHNSIQTRVPTPIVINKNEDMLQRLQSLNSKGFFPSALNTYLECSFKFYLRYVANIKQVKEIEEDLDNRIVGIFLHEAIELYYKKVQARKRSATIEASDLAGYEKDLSAILDDVFRKKYSLPDNKPVVYKGQRLVVYEIVKRFAERIIELDSAYAPFQIEALERDNLTYTINIEHAPFNVVLKGVIDRADKKGDVLRVVDYKTGSDIQEFKSMEEVFQREGRKKVKAVFQTLLYALLFSTEVKAGVKLVPGLFDRKNLFNRDFEFGLRLDKQPIENVLPLLPAFEEQLKIMLSELFNPAEPFTQTADTEACRYCEFTSICYRQSAE
jgi:hypothetical protein